MLDVRWGRASPETFSSPIFGKGTASSRTLVHAGRGITVKVGASEEAYGLEKGTFVAKR
jgi:hypothetical protein